MFKLSISHHLSKRTNQIVSHIKNHKTLITVCFVSILFLFGLGALVLKLRSHVLAQMKTQQKQNSSDIYYATQSGLTYTNLPIPTPPDDTSTPVITEDSSGNNDVYNPPDTSTPYPTPSDFPEPTITTYTTSTTSCAGTPTAYYSEATVSTGSTMVNTSATISIQLMDCNNSIAPVSDTLTVALGSGGDASTRINGSASPVTIQTLNGTATFSVNSQNPTTDTFIVTDTTRSFTVTDPSNHNPSVTFSNNSSGNSNCTTGSGVPNSWYSDVYPNPPITTSNGSVTLVVDIRDCNKTLAPVTDTLSISVLSGDSGTQVNGGSLPQNVTTQNGEATFSVASQVTGTVTLEVQDKTYSFTVTNANNNNPSITFSNSSSSSTPTPTTSPTPTLTPTPSTSTPTPTSAPTPSITPSPTSSGTPAPDPTPT